MNHTVKDAMTPEQASWRLSTIPFVRVLGMRALLAAAPGEAGRLVSALAPRPFLLDAKGALANGAIAAVIDQAGSVAIWGREGLSLPHATVSLSITFMDSTSEEVVFDSRIVSLGHGLGHTLVEARTAGGRPIAQAMVNYALGAYPGSSGGGGRPKDREGGLADNTDIPPLGGASFLEALGVRPPTDGAGLQMPFSLSLVGSRDPVALHGGAIAAGLISAADLQAQDRGLRLSHLSVDYLRSGLAQETRFAASVISESRKTLCVQVDALQEGGARRVATATARYFSSN